MHKTILLWCCYFLAVRPATAQQPVRVDKGFGESNETSVAINRLNPEEIIGGSNIDLIYISHDKGNTWQQKRMESTWGVYGDPVMLAAPYGRMFYAHLARNKEKAYPDWFDRMVIQYTDDGGATFSSGASAGANGNKMQDKPWLNIDRNMNSAYYNRLYVSWTEFDKYESADPKDKSRIRVAWSADSGKSFSAAVTVSDISGGCLDDDNTTEGATSASLPDGTLCLAWAAFGKIWFDVSHDGGKTWGKDRIIAEQTDGWDMEINQVYRTNGMPFLLHYPAKDKPFGRLYLLFGDKRYGDADIWLKWSDDGGKTWANERKLSNDANGNGKDQFMGHFCIDEITGNWYSIFYDRRKAYNDELLDVTLAWNSGDTIFNQFLGTSFPSPGKSRFFGDYIGIDAFNNFIIPLWTASKGDLQLFAFPAAREALTPNSSSTHSINILPNGRQLTIKSPASFSGQVTLRYKTLFIIQRSKTYKFNQTSDSEIVNIIKIKHRKAVKAEVKLKLTGTQYEENSRWYFPKK